jgi:hypothetical protein
VIYDFDFHPPDDARLFRMPAEGIRRLDVEAFVAEISYGDVIVRHYAFRDHWFKVNCTLDSDANFIETRSPEDDVPPFAFNCDIATPMLRRDNALFAVDLWLDVLGLIERRQLVGFLAAVHPFGPAVAPAAPDMQRVGLSDVAVLQPGARPTW